MNYTNDKEIIQRLQFGVHGSMRCVRRDSVFLIIELNDTHLLQGTVVPLSLLRF